MKSKERKTDKDGNIFCLLFTHFFLLQHIFSCFSYFLLLFTIIFILFIIFPLLLYFHLTFLFSSFTLFLLRFLHYSFVSFWRKQSSLHYFYSLALICFFSVLSFFYFIIFLTNHTQPRSSLVSFYFHQLLFHKSCLFTVSAPQLFFSLFFTHISLNACSSNHIFQLYSFFSSNLLNSFVFNFNTFYSFRFPCFLSSNLYYHSK